jgi:hypothetical protein
MSTVNLSLSPILNQILSHGSYTKDTSQLDVQHHQHMPLPSMYQDHQHTITRYVSQPCTKECTKPSTCTIPSINHVPQPVPKQVHQPCTNTCTITSASTMHQHLYHVPQPSTMYINMYHHHVHQQCILNHIQPCTNQMPSTHHICTISLNHIINAIHHVP